jgi:chromodomain-helicase-DNA-binding protein 4
VAYYGSKEAREKSFEYELYPGGSSYLKAHVVITSYEPPVKQNAFFKKIKWAGLVVDEGQRLKNEDGLLYKALNNLNIPFRLLLTG